MIALALGLVCWVATMILVESELSRPLREWLDSEADLWATIRADGEDDPENRLRFDVAKEVFYRKARYLASCHLCAGTWLALVLVALVPVHVFGSGFVGWVLGGLLVKAVAHLTLVVQKAGEAVSR